LVFCVWNGHKEEWRIRRETEFLLAWKPIAQDRVARIT
ncbi:MAG: hypothetical protein ACI9DF_003324, partial [Verrucomicrobiales bacterium]